MFLGHFIWVRFVLPGLAAAMLLIALGSPVAHASTGDVDDSLSRVRQRGELRWGADEQGGEPYVFEDRDGRLVGFEVELAGALARTLGLKARFVQNDWSTLLPALERGTFDVALNGLEITEARAARAHLSPAYVAFDELLVGRAEDVALATAPLAGEKVGTLASSLAWDLARAAGADTKPYEGVDEPFTDLAEGRLRAVLLDDIIVRRYLPRHAGLTVARIVGRGEYAFAVRREDRALGAALDGALATLMSSGELGAILARWQIPDRLSAPPPSGTPQPPRIELDPSSGKRRELTPHQLLLFGEAALVTLALSLASMVLASAWGLVLALLRFEAGPFARLASLYVELVRGTPLLLQLYLLYFGLAPLIAFGPLTAAILGLGMNYAAYEAEIYRGALQAVPRGQWEAAAALGMSRPLTYRRVILPQALRVALPGIVNDFISLLKDSSLVSVLTVVELTKRMAIVAVDNRGWLMPGLLCAALYWALGYPFSRLARRWEKRWTHFKPTNLD